MTSGMARITSDYGTLFFGKMYAKLSVSVLIQGEPYKKRQKTKENLSRHGGDFALQHGQKQNDIKFC